MERNERVLVGDTETTGIPFSDGRNGHRLVEIAMVELVGNMPTGRTFHRYINPGRKVDPEAMRVHGLTDEFLADKPRFREVVREFEEFIGDSPLVFHNASFDMGFIKGERRMLGRPEMANEIRDSLKEARLRFPGQRSSLDALASRLDVENTRNGLHGALVDASILADVWVKMTGLDRLALGGDASALPAAAAARRAALPRRPRPARAALAVPAADLAGHESFVAGSLKESIWSKLRQSC